MDQAKTGNLIRSLRQKQHMTQLELAEKINVSDKAVSKWERGCGAPDISLLPALAAALGVEPGVLLQGDLDANRRSNGNMKKIRVYVCPACGNVVFSTDEADVICCGKKLAALRPQKADETQRLTMEMVENEWFVTSAHEMRREHHISFLAQVNGDTLIVRRLYPEWGLETRLPYAAHGMLLWYCTRDGLFWQEVRR